MDKKKVNLKDLTIQVLNTLEKNESQYEDTYLKRLVSEVLEGRYGASRELSTALCTRVFIQAHAANNGAWPVTLIGTDVSGDTETVRRYIHGWRKARRVKMIPSQQFGNITIIPE